MRRFLICLIMGMFSAFAFGLSAPKKPAFYAYAIGSVHEGAPPSQRLHEDVYMTPASCQKVVTALIAYRKWPKDWRYQSKLYRQGRQAIFVASGDPTLSSEQLEEAFKHLDKHQPIDTLILDLSHFHLPYYSNNLMNGDAGSAFQPPVGAMNLDGNLIHIDYTPGHPPRNDLSLPMKLSVQKTQGPTQLDVFWYQNTLHIEGEINAKDWAKPMHFKASPLDLENYLKRKIRALPSGKKFKNIVMSHTPVRPRGQLCATVVSQPLSEIIPPALKKSDNLVFDALYLQMIHERFDPKRPLRHWADGDVWIKDFLKQYFQLEMTGALFVDGSGVSRYNRIQPQQLWVLLKKGYAVSDFVHALPRPLEVSSTLEHRKALPPHLRAKTGNMMGMTCLAGYHLGRVPQVFVFSASAFAPPSETMFSIIDPWLAQALS